MEVHPTLPLPTIYVFVARFVGFFVSRALCLACKACGCYEFVDKDFPKEKALRGLATAKRYPIPMSTLEACQWKRASELKPPEGMKRMQLFNGIEPQDIAQGLLGDCWLLASFAALAEHPSAVRRLFVNHEINDRGKYQVRLYNPVKGKFQIITIDDYIPVDSNGTPLFAKARGGEIWVCLLEKAFAKAARDLPGRSRRSRPIRPRGVREHHGESYDQGVPRDDRG